MGIYERPQVFERERADCTVRGLAVVSGLNYEIVHSALKKCGRRTYSSLNNHKVAVATTIAANIYFHTSESARNYYNSFITQVTTISYFQNISVSALGAGLGRTIEGLGAGLNGIIGRVRTELQSIGAYP